LVAKCRIGGETERRGRLLRGSRAAISRRALWLS
jgi:hypothetical protein